jgi:NAD(P)-dependent dehydrogenase (short-subunit alcohol dehydrogenase family)
LSSQVKELKFKILGSSSGIGLATAELLAKQGATIIFACRNEKKTLDVIQGIQKRTNNKQVKKSLFTTVALY